MNTLSPYVIPSQVREISSPNKHNIFTFKIESIQDNVCSVSEYHSDSYENCTFINETESNIRISETTKMMMDCFRDTIKQYPGIEIQITLVDAKLHEDAVHRGPAQVYPVMRDAIEKSILEDIEC
jgi:translation elongation factor EF-G